jgi:hypothetical protein
MVHTAAVIKKWIVAKSFRIEHPPCMLDLAKGTRALFPFPEHQEVAGWQGPDSGELLVHEGGAARSIAEEGFAILFRQWYQQCEECVRKSGSYYKKS